MRIEPDPPPDLLIARVYQDVNKYLEPKTTHSAAAKPNPHTIAIFPGLSKWESLARRRLRRDSITI